MKLLTLFNQCGDSDYKGAFGRLRQFYYNIGCNEHDAIIIDTSMSPDFYIGLGSKAVMIGGDNSRREFSGWDSALQKFNYILHDYDLINIVTSAFENEYNGFYKHISRDMLDYLSSADNAVLAHIDAYPDSVRMFGRSFQTWACSKFLFLKPAIIDKLKSFIGPYSKEFFFPKCGNLAFVEDAPISANYRVFITDWLTGNGLPHGKWHTVIKLTEDNLPIFQAKAMAIIDEHNLSMRLREVGAQLIDFTCFAKIFGDKSNVQFPNELEQVRLRNTYLFNDPIVTPGLDLDDYPTDFTIDWIFCSIASGKEVFPRCPIIEALWSGNRILQNYLDLDNELHRAAIFLNQNLKINEAQIEWLSKPDEHILQDTALPITRGLHALYLARDDLHNAFDINNRNGRDQMVRWWFIEGSNDPLISKFMPKKLDDLYKEVATNITQDTILPITKGLHAFYLSRLDLQKSFDLDSSQGRKDFVLWWFKEKVKGAQMVELIPPEEYTAIDFKIEQDQVLPITKGLHALCMARTDLKNSIDLSDRLGRLKLILWWFQEGVQDSCIYGLMPAEALLETAESIDQDSLLPITKGLYALYLSRLDLQKSFDINTTKGRNDLVLWWFSEKIEGRQFLDLIPQNAYCQNDNNIEQDQALPITIGLHALCMVKKDLEIEFNLKTKIGRSKLICWWLRDGTRNPMLSDLMPSEIYAETDSRVIQDAIIPITKGLHALYYCNTALRESLDIQTQSGRHLLIQWFLQNYLNDKKRQIFMPKNMDQYYSEIDDHIEQDAVLPITKELHINYLSRSDLQHAFDIHSKEGRNELITWWIQNNPQKTRVFDIFPKDSLFEIDREIEQDSEIPITRVIHAIYLARQDLIDAFDICIKDGRRGLTDWYQQLGQYEYKLIKSGPDAIDNHIEQDAVLPISKNLQIIYFNRSDLQDAFDIKSKEGRNKLIAWWIQNNQNKARAFDIFPADSLFEIDWNIEQDTEIQITRAIHAIYLARQDLRDAFDIHTKEGRRELTNWYQKYGQYEYELLLSRPIVIKDSNHSKAITKHGYYRRNGVNLIGFGRGELGIGEDVRMASMALRNENIDHCVPYLPLATNARQNDTSLKQFETFLPLYNVNLILLPNYENLRLAGATQNEIFGHRYNIAYWQWELPKFPSSMELSLSLVNEIWSSSKYTANAMKGVTEKPVIIMPMAVYLSSVYHPFKRKEIGIAEKDFIFLTILDGNSTLERKNPLAVVKAFKLAFPNAKSGTRLIIKTMNMNQTSGQWNEIIRLSNKDKRITIIDETFSREQVIALQKLSDCFVSLHRAEGFGRNIAEAMLSGKPVIVSNFSGNTDYNNTSNSYLVDGDIIPVKKGDYSFSDGQHWFNPSIDQAAMAMQECIEDIKKRHRIAIEGKRYITKLFSPEVVGKKYFDRFHQITDFTKI